VIQVLLVVIIDIARSRILGTLPMVTVEHWIKMPQRPKGRFVYSAIWLYNNNNNYHVHLDYIIETVPPPFVSNGIPHDLVIPSAIVDNFMNDICNVWM
jgi:hypothetical protein